MIILIDGPSGSGKTTLARTLGAALGWPVVHLDDFYPGWSGLGAARDMVPSVITERRYQRWDWEHNVAGSWVSVSRGDLIIEGVGAISAASISVDDEVLSILMTAPEDVRKARALARDEGYAPYWEHWAAQERKHFASMPAAQLVLRGG